MEWKKNVSPEKWNLSWRNWSIKRRSFSDSIYFQARETIHFLGAGEHTIMEEFRLLNEEKKSIVLYALCGQNIVVWWTVGLRHQGVVGHQDEPPSFHEDPGVWPNSVITTNHAQKVCVVNNTPQDNCIKGSACAVWLLLHELHGSDL